MTPDQVIKHFGSQGKAGLAVGVRQSVVSDWKRAGRVPSAWQIVIEHLTGGELLANRQDAFQEIKRKGPQTRPPRVINET